MTTHQVELSGLPGDELIIKGLADLGQGITDTQEALLIAIARTKLSKMGIDVPKVAFSIQDAELKLYAVVGLVAQDAFREYKALKNRLGKFERALQLRITRHKLSQNNVA